MTKIGGFSLLVNIGGVAKADIGPINAGRHKTDKAIWYSGKLLVAGLSQAPISNKFLSIQSCREHVSPGKLNNPVQIVKKNHTVVYDGINMEDKSKTAIGNMKHIFWHTSIMIKD